MVEELARGAHSEGVLQEELQGRRVVFSAEHRLVLLEDAEDHAIDDQPAVLPEEREEALHLVQRDNLGEQGHNPVLAEDENFHFFISKVRCQVRQFVMD